MQDVWQWMVSAGVVVAGVASLAGNISKIQATWGSLRNWLRHRKEIRDTAEKERIEQRERMDEFSRVVDEFRVQLSGLQAAVDHTRDIVLLQLREDIKNKSGAILSRGYIYNDEIDDLNEFYQHYTDEGGNGSAQSRMERCRKLPIKERGIA